MTTTARIARARALLRHALLHTLPESLVGIAGQDSLPDVRQTSLLAVARGLGQGGPGETTLQMLEQVRGDIEAATTAVNAAKGQDQVRTLGDVLARLRLPEPLEIAAELVLVLHVDPVTREAARLMAQVLHRGPGVGVGLLDDTLMLAGWGPGLLAQISGPRGALQRLGVLELRDLVGGDPSDRVVVPSARILSYMNGTDDPDPALAPHLSRQNWDSEERAALDEALTPVAARLEAAVSAGRPVLLRASAGAGGLTSAQLVAARLGRPLVAVMGAALWAKPDVLAAAVCQSRLTGALLCVVGAGDLPESWLDGREAILAVAEDLGALALPPILLFHGRIPPLFGEVLARVADAVEVEVKPLDLAQRKTIFRAVLTGRPDCEALVERGAGYALGAESIVVACRYARYKADSTLRDGEVGRVSIADLRDACAVTVTRRLREFATRVDALATWDDLVLDTEVLEQIRDIVRYARHRDRIFREWGFAKKMSSGRALSCLFSGPSGTGKTMVAGLVARDLGVELFRVDLSSVVSKYIGETEQRLDALFTEAAQTGVALLFDEADSLFAKRTEVQSSNDRYANLEVNFLLQRLDDFDGIVFLTTNFGSSIDEAFLRRLRFRIEFPAPGPNERGRMWEVMLPEEMPLDDDLDLEWIGKSYDLSGGHIRNATLRAALLAADAGTPLTMDLALKAVNAEYRELGRLPPPPPSGGW